MRYKPPAFYFGLLFLSLHTTAIGETSVCLVLQNIMKNAFEIEVINTAERVGGPPFTALCHDSRLVDCGEDYFSFCSPYAILYYIVNLPVFNLIFIRTDSLPLYIALLS